MNTYLIWQARCLITGANVHLANTLITKYMGAYRLLEMGEIDSSVLESTERDLRNFVQEEKKHAYSRLV